MSVGGGSLSSFLVHSWSLVSSRDLVRGRTRLRKLLLDRGLTSVEEVALITGSSWHLDSAGNFPSDISGGDAREEVQLVYVVRLQATSDQAGTGHACSAEE